MIDEIEKTLPEQLREKSLKKYIIWFAGSIYRVAALYVGSILLCSVLFSLLENKTIMESIWWCLVSALTIGYGDIAPVTTGGRILAIFFSHFWVFGIAPLIVVNVLQAVTQDRDKFTNEEQEEIKKMLKEIHAKMK